MNLNFGEKGSFLAVIANAGWMAGGRFAGDLLTLLLFILFSRSFGPEGVGQYAYGFAIAGLLYWTVNMGVEDYAIRECSTMPRNDRGAFIGRILAIQLGGVVLAAFGVIVFLSIAKVSSDKATIILLLSGQQMALALSRTLFAPVWAEEKMIAPALAELLCRTGTVTASAAMVIMMHASLPMALIPFAVGGLSLLGISAFWVRRYVTNLRLDVSRECTTAIVRVAWPFAVSGVVFYASSRLSLIIVSLVLGDAATGIYASTLKFLEVGLVPITFLAVAAYPNLSRLFQQNDEAFLEAANRLFQLALVAGGLLAWALMFLVPAFIVPVLGEQFASAIPVVRLVAVTALLFPIGIVVARFLFATHLQLTRLKIQTWGVVLQVAFTLILLPFYGIAGAVYASIIQLVLMYAGYLKALQTKCSTAALAGTLGWFVALVSGGVLVGEISSWALPFTWTAAVATLATFGAAAIGTRFIPWPEALRP